MNSGRWVGERWHGFDGAEEEILVAGKGINDEEKEGYSQAQELARTGMNWDKGFLSWEY